MPEVTYNRVEYSEIESVSRLAIPSGVCLRPYLRTHWYAGYVSGNLVSTGGVSLKSNMAGETFCRLRAIWTHPSWRGCGLGLGMTTLLLQSVPARGNKLKAKYVDLYSKHVGFWEKRNFVAIGVAPFNPQLRHYLCLLERRNEQSGSC